MTTSKPSSFASAVSMTHISTATAILSIDGINFLLDPAFAPAGSEYSLGNIKLKRFEGPVIGMDKLPPTDAILLSHEDHQDNLDDSGRTLLNGRHVVTTMDGSNKISPRPGVKGLGPWESTKITLAGKDFCITAAPCDHLPGGECIGFVIQADSFGTTADGRPNVIYISGDTVYMADVAQHLHREYNVVLAVLNLGAATVPLASGPLMVTMNSTQALCFIEDVQPCVVVPLHYDSWEHFAERTTLLQEILNSADAFLEAKTRQNVPFLYNCLV